MPCKSKMLNCGTQFCFHRNQFGGIFIFNYSTTSNFPFTPRPDRRREIACVNHPWKLLTSLKSPCMEGALAGPWECALAFRDKWGHQMAFCPRHRDTVWYFFSLSRRKTDNLLVRKSDSLGKWEKGSSPLPFFLNSLSVPIYPAPQRVLHKSLAIIGNNGSDSRAPSSHHCDPEKMNWILVSYSLLWRSLAPRHRQIKQLVQVSQTS